MAKKKEKKPKTEFYVTVDTWENGQSMSKTIYTMKELHVSEHCSTDGSHRTKHVQVEGSYSAAYGSGSNSGEKLE